MFISASGLRKVLIGAGVIVVSSSCIHHRSATRSNQEVWEVVNGSRCTAFVALETRHARIVSLGTVPSGGTQTYRIAPVRGAFVSALSLEEDGTTGCAGGDLSQRQLKIRKLRAET